MALAKLLIQVPTEVAQRLGEVLIRAGAGGVEEQSAERGARLVVYGEQPAELEALAERARAALAQPAQGSPAVAFTWRIELDQDSDWETAWTRYLVQQPLTRHWVIQPEWDNTPAPAGKGQILIRPTLAFGDGAHETTRMAAEGVEQFCLSHPGSAVLDIGTGTGVLAMVAALTGAHPVVGTDIDPVALGAALGNAQRNQLEARITFQDVKTPLPSGFDLVVANLEPRALHLAASEITSHARRARELLLTGFLSEQSAQLNAAFGALGFKEFARVEHDGWCLLVLHPQP